MGSDKSDQRLSEPCPPAGNHQVNRGRALGGKAQRTFRGPGISPLFQENGISHNKYLAPSFEDRVGRPSGFTSLDRALGGYDHRIAAEGSYPPANALDRRERHATPAGGHAIGEKKSRPA